MHISVSRYMNKTLTLIICPLRVLHKSAVYKGDYSILQTTYNTQYTFSFTLASFDSPCCNIAYSHIYTKKLKVPQLTADMNLKLKVILAVEI